jgi:pimeloyl-ACP methyl ester carboxylesterase
MKSLLGAVAVSAILVGCAQTVDPRPASSPAVSAAAVSTPCPADAGGPPQIPSEDAQLSAAGAQSRFATVNNIKMHYLVAGNGPPILLLHGYTETSHMWLPIMGQLARTNTVIAPDLRGAGLTDKPPSGYEKKTMAQDVHALAQSLGLHRAKVVGHDIGLMVAYAYAAQYPDDVETIVLMDAFLPGVGDWKNVWLLRDLWHFHFTGEVPLKLVAGRERTYFEHFWNDFAADKNHSVPEADREFYAASYAQPGGMRAGFGYFQAFPQDAVDFAGFANTKLQMPMLVLTGEKASGTFLIDQGKLVASNVRGIVVKGSGHWLMEEAPQQTIPALTVFLQNAAH